MPNVTGNLWDTLVLMAGSLDSPLDVGTSGGLTGSRSATSGFRGVVRATRLLGGRGGGGVILRLKVLLFARTLDSTDRQEAGKTHTHTHSTRRESLLLPRQDEDTAALLQVVQAGLRLLDVLVDDVHLVVHVVQLL